MRCVLSIEKYLSSVRIYDMNARPTKRGERWLLNRYPKKEALKRLAAEDFKRITLSFYRYVNLGTQEQVHELRDTLFLEWEDLGCFGRVYMAQEGINAQMSVPEHMLDAFKESLYAHGAFKDVPFKIAVTDGTAFWNLHIKVKNQIVADGLTLGDYDIENVGNHLDAASFNKAMEDSNTIVVDMRNEYESDIGHFKWAYTPKVATFKEELPTVATTLSGKEDRKVLLYCTGGIRCEKASAYLKSKGFKDVNQLHGGIIAYKHQTDEQGLENKFIGSNYVFDGRTREPISGDIISTCSDCDTPCDLHVNCKNDACNKLYLQCDACITRTATTCSESCFEKLAQLVTD